MKSRERKTLLLWLTATIAVLGIYLMMTAAEAIPRCAPYTEMIAALKSQYREEAGGAGLASAQAYVELWVEPGGKSWTILAVETNGSSCVLAAGSMWEFRELPLPGKDS